MFGRKKTSEWKRTCRRDQTVWYVTDRERNMRAPNSLQIAGEKMKSAGNRGKLVGGTSKAMVAEQRVGRLEAERDTVERINRCPTCGSTSFDEAPAD